ncbi:MAG: phosphoribosylformylglycinamidine cyclo-ligase [Dehalococcoidia bacterium]
MDGDRYISSGVNIDSGNEVIRLISPIVRDTYTNNVLGDIGGFGGLFALGNYSEPILVASADGVGTKLRIAVAMDLMSSIGIDLANHSINDVWVQGADPLFFLDYIATGNIKPKQIAEIIQGLSAALKIAGCSLIGGETAEMPGVYKDGDFDIAGFIVGAVEKENLIDGSSIAAGDVLVGFPSSGLHTNGFSLVRHIFGLDDNVKPLDVKYSDLGTTLGEALMAQHVSYYSALKPIQQLLKGMAHITGGGIVENLPRIIPEHLKCIVRKDSWKVPALFNIIQRHGNVDWNEMYRVFNMGVGLVGIVRPEDLKLVKSSLDGSFVMGEIANREPNESRIDFL